MGPPVRLWCMRMEAKHKQLKKWAQNSSYKNPCLTLATRHQQYAAYALSSRRFNSSEAVTYTGILIKFNAYILYYVCIIILLLLCDSHTIII